jgi:hypothetical protein
LSFKYDVFVVFHPKKILLIPISNQEDKGGRRPSIHLHSHQGFCPELIQTDQQQSGRKDMRIRFWLDSTEKHQDGTQFVSYDLLIPNLK